MINLMRDEILENLKAGMDGYSFYKRISERITDFPAIVVDMRSDHLIGAGNSMDKAFNSVYTFDVWCIYSEIQTEGDKEKDIDIAESNVVSGVSQIRDILATQYCEMAGINMQVL